MKYLIKLEDRDINREVIIECQEDMTLEELNRKIKDELFLPRHGEIGHSFQTNGQIFVPCPEVLKERWKDRDFLSSKDICLNEVFTIKESAILFQQIHRSYRMRIYCTLKDRA